MLPNSGERAFFEAPVKDVRKVAMRIAIVLGRDGGAFVPLRTMTLLGTGGKQGKGDQFFSWLHVDDFTGMVDFIMLHPEISGPVNLAAPHPVCNRKFMGILRKVLRVPVGVPMPAWLLELGAMLIGTETELILKSRRVAPAVLQQAGYPHKFPDLKEALTDLCGRA